MKFGSKCLPRSTCRPTWRRRALSWPTCALRATCPCWPSMMSSPPRCRGTGRMKSSGCSRRVSTSVAWLPTPTQVSLQSSRPWSRPLTHQMRASEGPRLLWRPYTSNKLNAIDFVIAIQCRMSRNHHGDHHLCRVPGVNVSFCSDPTRCPRLAEINVMPQDSSAGLIMPLPACFAPQCTLNSAH